MVDLATCSREALLAVIARQQRELLALQRELADVRADQQRLLALAQEQQLTIERLQARLRDLEAERDAGSGGRRMPGLKDQQAPADRPAPERKRRARGFARRRQQPTDIVQHALDRCPDCGDPLSGGTVKRRRQVLEVRPAPVDVIEHVYLERTCRRCRRRWTPRADLGAEVTGQQRLGLGLVSLIVSLREAGRLPVRTIQWYLEQVHGLRLSVGAIVQVCHRTAERGEPELAQLRAAIRASPVVYADETGWRQAGRNGYVWSFSTARVLLLQYGRRTKEMVDRVLDATFSGILTSDFYAAYHHDEGLHQRCWAHLLREIHELRVKHPAHEPLASWAAGVHALYQQARQEQASAEAARAQAATGYEERLLALCQPYLADRTAPQRQLCARIEKHLAELFVFVAHPETASDNNAAERSLRHLVTSRKISGGTRSDQGTRAKMTLGSLFGSWKLQGRNPLDECRRLLASPQV